MTLHSTTMRAQGAQAKLFDIQTKSPGHKAGIELSSLPARVREAVSRGPVPARAMQLFGRVVVQSVPDMRAVVNTKGKGKRGREGAAERRSSSEKRAGARFY